MKVEPKITVITICKNSELTLSKCIESVLNQIYSNIEYIIVDGDSKDNSQELIKRYSHKINKIICEPDDGIYDAMNKGITASTGDYIIFLNADDYFISDYSIYNLVKSINNLRKGDVYYGQVMLYNKDSGEGNIWQATKISKYSIFRGSIPHPSTIYCKSAFEICGLFDTSYKIVGDYEWLVRSYLEKKITFIPIKNIVSVFNNGGISTNKKYEALISSEIDRVRNTYYNKREIRFYHLKWFLKRKLGF